MYTSKGVITLKSVLTSDEIAEEWNLKSHTVRAWIRSGELKAYKLGNQWRIKREDWEAFIASQQQPKKVSDLALAY